MRSAVLLVAAVASIALSGCALSYKAPIRPAQGIFFSHYKVPITTDFQGTPAETLKVGRSTSTYILIPLFGAWDFAFDDAAVKKAADDGGIAKVHYADHEYLQVLGLFARFTTTVYGE